MVPSSNICTVSSMSACRNSPGISFTTTIQPYLASILIDIIFTSSDTVSKLASSLSVYCHCSLPSAQPHAFIPFSLYRHQVSQSFLPVFVSLLIFPFRYHCLSYMQLVQLFHQLSIPYSPNSSISALTYICISMMWAWGFSLSMYDDCCQVCIKLNCCFGFISLGFSLYPCVAILR